MDGWMDGYIDIDIKSMLRIYFPSDLDYDQYGKIQDKSKAPKKQQNVVLQSRDGVWW